jgi:hypothetical protein
MSWFSSRLRLLTVSAVTLLFLVGCGGTGSVSGKVTLNGKPLPGGIVFAHHGKKGQVAPASGLINPDGSYFVANILTGQTTLTVLTAAGMGNALHPDTWHPPFGEYVPIPPKYMSLETSGFELNVKVGKQEMNLELTGETGEETKPSS